jgi:hypothetical protein
VKYFVNGRPVREGTGSEKEKAVRDFLKGRRQLECLGSADK